MNQIQLIDGVEINTASRLNANDTTPINHLDDMIRSAPAPQEGINADPEMFQGLRIEQRNGSMVIVNAEGTVVGTLSRKKISYADRIKQKFQEKRLNEIQAKQAKQA
jgi:hypothetical protein